MRATPRAPFGIAFVQGGIIRSYILIMVPYCKLRRRSPSPDGSSLLYRTIALCDFAAPNDRPVHTRDPVGHAPTSNSWGYRPLPPQLPEGRLSSSKPRIPRPKCSADW